MDFKKVFVLLIALMILTPSFAFAAEWDSFDSSAGKTSTDQISENSEKNTDSQFSENIENSDLSLNSSESDQFEESNLTDNQQDLEENTGSDMQLMSASTTTETPVIDTSSFTALQNPDLYTSNDAYLTSLYSGAAVYTYPIQVPKGINDFQPKIELTYNSQSVGGQYGWLGDGWSLNEYYIVRDVYFTPSDTSDDKFKLIFDGQNHNLIFDEENGFYHTEIETYMRVQRLDGGENQKNEYWLVTTKDGIKYRFGYTEDSELMNSVVGRDYVHQWKLDQMEDLNGNLIFYNYVKNPIEGEIGTSYLSEISYNNGLNVVEFEKIEKNSVFENYSQGNHISEKSLLSSINIYSGNESFFNYNTYFDTTDAHVLLNSIEKCDRNLNLSTSFKYKDIKPKNLHLTSNTIPFEEFPPVILEYTENPIIPADLNGDGLMDFIYSTYKGNNTTYQVWMNTGNGFDYSIKTVPIEEFPGVYYYKGNKNFRALDINGDGLTDFIDSRKHFNDTIYQMWINTGDGFSYSKGMVPFEEFPPVILEYTENPIIPADLNGDGLIDFIYSTYKGNNTTYQIWMNTGNGFDYSIKTVPIEEFPGIYYYKGNKNFRALDINGDGLTDFIDSRKHFNNTIYQMWINTGDGFSYSKGTVPFEEFPPVILEYTENPIIPADLNGDGLIDFIYSTYKGNNTTYQIWMNTGNGFDYSIKTVPIEEFPGIYYYKGNNNFRALDINGDGLTDFIDSRKHFNNTIYKVWMNNYPGAYHLSEIQSSSGVITKIEYETSTKFNNIKEDGTQGLPTPINVVKKVEIDNGVTDEHHTISTYTYDYEGGFMHVEPKGKTEFRGFRKVTVDDGRSITEHYFHQDQTQKGKEYKTIIKSDSDELYSITENGFSVNETNGIFEVLMTNSTQSLYDKQVNPIVSETSYNYDSYGNPTEIRNEGDISVTGDEKTLVFEYVYNTGDWILNSVTRETLEGHYGQKIAESAFYYDGSTDLNSMPVRGLITKTVDWNNHGEDIIQDFEYDSYGNLIAQYDGNGHLITVEYDNNPIFPSSFTNAMNQQTFLEYDLSIGKLVKTTDPNGFETEMEYDGFGRITKVIKPEDSPSSPTVSYQYFIDGIAPEYVQISVKEGENQYYDTWKYYDGLKRVIKTESESEDPTENIIQETYYDNFGGISTITAPRKSFEPKLNTTNDYDSFGRLIQITTPDGSSKSVEYEQLKTITFDENGHKIQSDKDVYGNIVKVTEFNGNDVYETGYEYNAANNLIKIIPNQYYDQINITFLIENENETVEGLENTTAIEMDFSSLGFDTTYKVENITFTYDSLGQLVELDDPDLGVWRYSYNANGKKSSETDNKGITTYYDFDPLNRPILIDYPNDSDVIFEYDNGTIGELSKVTSEITEKSYSYDNRLRVTESVISIDGTDYTTSYIYDSMDRITQKTLPTGEVVDFVYNNQALLSSIPGIIDSISYNSMNLMTRKEFSNNVSTDLTYDGWTQRLENINTPNLQNLDYSFDEKGNIVGISDNILDENQYFFYDDLDRLILAGSENYAQSFAYNPLGSILAHRSKDLTTGDEIMFGFEYGNNAGIHAPTRVADMELFYDANGNLIEDADFVYIYNDANRLTEVLKKSENNQVIAEFVYDESGNRIKKIENGIVSYYITEDFDIEDGEETVYYFANGDRVAKNSAEGTFWYLDDHLGSTNVMIDSDGELVERTIYYPFGSHREGGEEKYSFTGKEFDSEIGLYYYGARYYNPETFVFTQADSIIPDVYNPQALNRYSYCYNNPLIYEDPDGHTPLVVTALIGAGVGALIGGGISAYHQYTQTGQVNWKEVGKDALVGGITGGVIGLTCGVAAAAGGGLGATLIIESHAGLMVGMGNGVIDRSIDAAYEGNNFTESLNAGFDGNQMLVDGTIGAIPLVDDVTGSVLYSQTTSNLEIEANSTNIVKQGADDFKKRIGTPVEKKVEAAGNSFKNAVNSKTNPYKNKLRTWKAKRSSK